MVRAVYSRWSPNRHVATGGGGALGSRPLLRAVPPDENSAVYCKVKALKPLQDVNSCQSVLPLLSRPCVGWLHGGFYDKQTERMGRDRQRWAVDKLTTDAVLFGCSYVCILYSPVKWVLKNRFYFRSTSSYRWQWREISRLRSLYMQWFANWQYRCNSMLPINVAGLSAY